MCIVIFLFYYECTCSNTSLHFLLFFIIVFIFHLFTSLNVKFQKYVYHLISLIIYLLQYILLFSLLTFHFLLLFPLTCSFLSLIEKVYDMALQSMELVYQSQDHFLPSISKKYMLCYVMIYYLMWCYVMLCYVMI